MTVTKQQQLEWLAEKYKSWPEQGATSLGLSVSEVGKFAIVNSYVITRKEWQQERDKMQEQPAQPAQDNSWHERGEFPPVGCECDIRHSYCNPEKYEKVTVAAITNEYVIVKYATFEQHYMLKDISFRPIRTERDKLVELIKTYRHTFRSDTEFADAILAAGFKRGEL